MNIDYSRFNTDVVTQKEFMNVTPSDEFKQKTTEELADEIKKDEDGDEDEDEGLTSDPIDPTVYKGLYTYYAKKDGIEVPKDLVIESAEDFENLFNENIIQKRIKDSDEQRFANAHPRIKKLLDVKEYFDDEVVALNFVENLEVLKSFTEESISENEELQAELYKDFLITSKGNTPEEAEEAVEEARTLSNLDSKAIFAQKRLIDYHENNLDTIKQSKINSQKLLEEKEEEKMKSILENFKKTETIGDIKVTDELKKEVEKRFSKVVKVEKGKSYNDLAFKQKEHPEQMEVAFQYINALGLMNIDKDGKWNPDFSKLSSITTKKLKAKLDESIREAQNQGGKVGDSMYDDKPLTKLGLI